MEKIHRFEKFKDKSLGYLGIILMAIGSIILIPSCIITLNSRGDFATLLTILGLGLLWFGNRFRNEGNIKLVLTINENGISQTGSSGNNQYDWQLSWSEIKDISYNKNTVSITINLLQTYKNTTYTIIQIQYYENLFQIYGIIKSQIESYSKKEAEHKQQEEAYFQQITRLEEIQKLDPIHFEKIISTLFKKMGYEVLLTKTSRDEGIDLIITKNGRKSVVQCKRYTGNVGQPIVRDLYGSMIHNRAENAYLITTGLFSLPAQTWASGKPIYLVDGKMLIEWIEEILSKK